MKLFGILLTISASLYFLSGCSLLNNMSGEEIDGNLETAFNNDTGEGSIELLTSDITTESNQIEIQTHGIDEDKHTSISVANETIYEGTIDNDSVYTLQIADIDGALSTDYDPKIQLLQTTTDDDDGDITTFKEIRYSVEEE
ncbi:hypothetical protein [Corticicoccus populi]|uniref:Lipoprotein n=1 Tax=Corticicoccus populi TaxID=1812821 RepID=A0ABW5WWA6_9STAP